MHSGPTHTAHTALGPAAPACTCRQVWMSGRLVNINSKTAAFNQQ